MAVYGLNDSDRRKVAAALNYTRRQPQRVEGVIVPPQRGESYPREIEWVNGYSEACPPGGVIKIYEYETDDSGPRWRLYGTQPDEERGTFYAINGSSAVESGAIGQCLLYGHVLARLPDGIEQGDKMYAKPGSWDAATSGQYQIGKALGYENTQINIAGANAALKPILLETDEPIYWLKRCHEPGLSAIAAAAFQVGNDLEDAVDMVVKLDDGKCYRVYENNPDGEGTALERVNRCPARCVTVMKIFADCETCNACWKLTRCDDNEVIKYTRSDLSDYEGGVVKLVGEEEYCWEVSQAATGECDSPEPVEMLQNYSDCSYCSKCYNVENCHDSGDTRVISLDLGELFPEDTDASAIIAAERVIRLEGRCYKIVSEAMDCSSAEYPGDVTAYDDCDSCACYMLTRCDDSETTIQAHAADGPDGSLDLGDYLDKTVRLDDGFCYTVTDGGDCTDSTAVTVLESYDDCSSCKCWTLKLCGSGDPGTTLTTYSDLSGYGTGAIVKQNTGDLETPTEGDCYEIIDDAAEFAGTVEFLVFEDKSYSSCETCNAEQKYLLTNDCEQEACAGGDPADPIITTEDLAVAVGQWVKVKGICYSVAETDTGDVTDETLEYDGPYESCESCLAAVTTWTERVMLDMVVGDDGESWVKRYKTVTFTGTGACPDTETIAGDDCS